MVLAFRSVKFPSGFLAFLSILTLSLLILFSFAHPSPVNAIEGDPQLSIESLNARIAEIEANTQIDEEVKKDALGMLRSAVSNVELQASQLKRAEAFKQSLDSAPGETASAVSELEKLKQQPALAIDKAASAAELEQLLTAEQAKFNSARTTVLDLEKELSNQQKRPDEIRDRISRIRAKLTEIEDAIRVAPKPDEPPEIVKARKLANDTKVLSLNAELELINQEMLSHSVRMEALKARFELENYRFSRLQAATQQIEQTLISQQQKDAQKTAEETKRQQEETAEMNVELANVAEANTRLSENLLSLSKALEEINLETDEANRLTEEVGDEFQSLKQKLDVAGVNHAIARLLIGQRNTIQTISPKKSDALAREELITTLALNQINHEETLKDLQDIPTFIGTYIADHPELDNRKDRASLQTLLEQRRLVVNEMVLLEKSYLRALSDLTFSEQQLEDLISRFYAYLSERLLWVRSAPKPRFEQFLYIQEDAEEFLTWPLWRDALEPVGQRPGWLILVALLVLVALVVRHRRQNIMAKIASTASYIGNPKRDSFRYTSEALLLTVILSGSWPLVFYVAGHISDTGDLEDTINTSMSAAFFWLAECAFFLFFISNLCNPSGLGEKHFRWSAVTLSHIKPLVKKLAFGILPLGALVGFLLKLNSATVDWGSGRLATILVTIPIALFFIRLFSPRYETLADVEKKSPDSLLIRWKRIWQFLGVGLSVLLAALAFSGYVYTSGILIGLTLTSVWWVLSLVVAQNFLFRWLRITRRRIAWQSSIKAQEDVDEKSFEEEAPDLNELSESSRNLIAVVSVLFIVFGLLNIWQEIIPALSLFNTIELWSYESVEAGSKVLKAVTLVDLAFALLIIVVTFFMTRSLPSLLELFLLRVFRMQASDRYTIVTLTRYATIAVGLTLAAATLGGSWEQIQWLVAALSVGIGFGLQEIVANFISGLVILVERPIRVGDRVTIGELDGIVTRIRIRATTIQTWDRQELLVPNKNFITETLLNWSLSDQISRLVIQVDLAYGSDVNRALELMKEAAEQNPKVMADPPPFVTFDKMINNAYSLTLRCYLDDMDVRLSATSEINDAINTKLAAEGIALAVPQRQMLMGGS